MGKAPKLDLPIGKKFLWAADRHRRGAVRVGVIEPIGAHAQCDARHAIEPMSVQYHAAVELLPDHVRVLHFEHQTGQCRAAELELIVAGGEVEARLGPTKSANV